MEGWKHKILTNKPGIIIKNKTDNMCLVIEMAEKELRI
jgi:hypothetical protein